MRRLVLRGGALGLGARGFYTVSQLASQILMARLLGPKHYGTVQVTLSWVIVAAAAAQGGLHRVPTAVCSGKWDGEEAPAARMAAEYAAQRTVLLSALVISLLLLAASVSMIGREASETLRLLAPVVIFYNMALLGAAVGLSAGRVSGEAIGLKMSQPLVLLVWLAAIFRLKQTGAESELVAVGISVSWAVAAAVVWVPQLRLIRSIARDASTGAEELAARRRAWRGVALASYASDVSYRVRGLLDVLAVGAFIGGTVAGLYTLAARIAGLLGTVLESVNGLTAFTVASLIHRDQARRIPGEVRRISLSVFSIVLVPAGLLIGGGAVALRLFGSEFGAAAPFLAVLIVGQLVSVAVGPTEYYLLTTGRQRALAWIGMGTLTVMALCVPLAIHVAGGIGLAVATAGCLAAHNLAQAWVLRHDGIFLWQSRSFWARVGLVALVGLLSRAVAHDWPSYLAVSAVIAVPIVTWLLVGGGRNGTLWEGTRDAVP